MVPRLWSVPRGCPHRRGLLLLDGASFIYHVCAQIGLPSTFTKVVCSTRYPGLCQASGPILDIFEPVKHSQDETTSKGDASHGGLYAGPSISHVFQGKKNTTQLILLICRFCSIGRRHYLHTEHLMVAERRPSTPIGVTLGPCWELCKRSCFSFDIRWFS
ncbi:hypothetical protein CPB86DRAFT_249959 [Serendipita vermifera]|nr:hypothetical protein CPB86DRAFT_249959 [Serendipita vermifera]